MKQKVKVKGTVRIIHRDATGNVIEDREESNLIVDTGLAFLASRAVGVADPVMTDMALGTGNTPEVPGDTTLETENARVALAGAIAALNVVTYTASFPPGTGTGAITEAGIFNNNPGGTMLNRITFAVINKAVGDTIDVTWTVTFADDGV
jgi:hypothetical protein